MNRPTSATENGLHTWNVFKETAHNQCYRGWRMKLRGRNAESSQFRNSSNGIGCALTLNNRTMPLRIIGCLIHVSCLIYKATCLYTMIHTMIHARVQTMIHTMVYTKVHTVVYTLVQTIVHTMSVDGLPIWALFLRSRAKWSLKGWKGYTVGMFSNKLLRFLY